MRSIVRAGIAAIIVTATVFGAGCAAEEPQTVLEPKIAPPAIVEAGVLRVGVDMEYPPFAGKDRGREAGIDVDVATALAERLSLNLELVQVAPAEATTALSEGKVDVVLSVPLSEEAVMGATIAGTYISDGPGFFVSGEETETLTVASLGTRSVGAQDASPSYWKLDYELGQGGVKGYPTLREAFQALADGKVDVVAGDAVVGAYLARDFDGIRFVGQLDPATGLGAAVAQDNTELEQSVRDILDVLAADGVLDAIRATWVGDLTALDTGGDLAP